MVDIKYCTFFNRDYSFINNAYKEKVNKFLFNHSGIYIIKNNITKDCYVGKSVNVSHRIAEHKSLLKNDKHRYRNGERTILQKAWNKYGNENFSFEILEFCDKENISDREIFWIDYYKCNHAKYRNGYNSTDGGGSLGISRLNNRIQINNGVEQRMIAKEDLKKYEKIGYIKGLLPENIEKAINNKSGFRKSGYSLSEETKKKMSNSHKGKSATWLIGTKATEETKKKLSLAHKGKKKTIETIEKTANANRKPIIQFTKDGIKVGSYESAVEANAKTGINRSHISQCCKGKRITSGGYIWRYLDDVENI